MDRRVQKTRDAIFEAFNRLLKKKSYSKITIQQIIDEANIGRTTFYAHFETKDELLKGMCNEILNTGFVDSRNSVHTHNADLKSDTPEARIAHMLYHLKDNKKMVVGMLTCESRDLFLKYFKEYLNSFACDYLIEELKPNSNKVPQDFLINHISGSLVNTVQWWINGKMTTSPEKTAEYFIEVIKPVI